VTDRAVPSDSGRWTPWAILAFALLFSGGAIANLIDGDYANAAVGGGIGVVLGATFAFHQREQARDRAFRAWLTGHAHEIRNGNAAYHGVRIGLDTPLRQFTMCISLLIISFRLQSRLLVDRKDSIAGRAALYTTVSLLLGWWSLRGLLWTPEAIFSNLHGGKIVRVPALLPAEPRLRQGVAKTIT